MDTESSIYCNWMCLTTRFLWTQQASKESEAIQRLEFDQQENFFRCLVNTQTMRCLYSLWYLLIFQLLISTHAEYDSMAIAGDMALENQPLYHTIFTFVTDSGSIIISIGNWCHMPIMPIQYRILLNFQLLIDRGHAVRLRYVPSHMLEQDQVSISIKQCPDIIGNSQVDQECTRLLLSTELPGHILPTTMITRAVGRAATKTRAPIPRTSQFNQVARHLTPASRKALRKTSRLTSVTIARLMTNHIAMNGYPYRMRKKTQPTTTPSEDEVCRFCSISAELPLHLLFECQHASVATARANVQEPSLFTSLPSAPNPQILLKTWIKSLTNEFYWNSIVQFFQELDVNV